MPDERWRAGYDAWKTTDPNDRYLGPDPDDPGEDEDADGCTCPRTLGAGGARMTDEWCPLHGRDPDEEYERMRDEDV